MKLKLTFLFLILICISAAAQPKGKLFIIGGGAIPEYMIQKYVELAGGKDASFLIIPMASAEPVQSAASFRKKLIAAGCVKIKELIADRKSVDADSNLAKIDGTDAVFFTGGDQSNLTKVFNGTEALKRITSKYRKGSLIGGTSAGAAVMSRIMITGKELVNKDTANSYSAILKGNIETAEGFGFVTGAVIDQHFIKRKRLTRLINIIADKRELTGVGIDESTAIIVTRGKNCEVFGESLVTVVKADKKKKVTYDKNNHPALSGFLLSLFKSGDKFRLE